MSFQKICSFLPSTELRKYPIRYGDDISWHFASFQDLMTENPTMTATSYLVGVQSGKVGTRGSWLLEQIHLAHCSLGEMSIWEKDNIISFVRVVQHNNFQSKSYLECADAANDLVAFAQRVKDEAKALGGEEQLQLAEAEIGEFSCVHFRDHWFGERSALLDIDIFGGRLDLINIRRGYNQGWWALALRRFGRAVREGRQAKGKVSK